MTHDDNRESLERVAEESQAAAGDARLYSFPFEIIDGDKPRRGRALCRVPGPTFEAVKAVLDAGGGPFTYHKVGEGDGTFKVSFGCDGVVYDEHGKPAICDIAMSYHEIDQDPERVDWSSIWLEVAQEAAKFVGQNPPRQAEPGDDQAGGSTDAG